MLDSFGNLNLSVKLNQLGFVWMNIEIVVKDFTYCQPSTPQARKQLA